MITLRSPACLLVAGLAGLAAAPRPAAAGPNGSIVLTDKKIDAGARNFKKEVKASAKTVIAKPAESENWHLYFVAYLNRAPGDPDVNIVFYDPAQKGEREPVNAYPIHTKPTAKILVSDVEIKPEEGFKPGKKYQVLITRLVNGKEDVYARSTVELK